METIVGDDGQQELTAAGPSVEAGDVTDREKAGNGLLYRTIFRRIAEDISTGVLAPGQRLPSERELGEEHSVSRATIRRAIKQLVDDGLVESRQGAGTFVVTTGPLGEARNTLMSFTELGAARGLRATAHVFSASVRRATLDEAEQLNVAPGAKLFELERLRFLDGVPTSIDQSLVPLAVAPSLPSHDFENESLYAVLERNGARPHRADYTVEALEADDFVAEHLAVSPGSPVLYTRTLSYDSSGGIVESGQMFYRGDRYRFRATLMRRRW